MDIDGKALAAKIRNDIKHLITEKNLTPTLAFFMIDGHEPSAIYVKMKVKACQEVGIQSIKEVIPPSITEKELLQKIDKANNDKNIDAIIVQMPLPNHINSNKILLAINPKKDVDGFHPINIGKLMIGEKDAIAPCTPYGICKMLQMENIETSGKKIAVIGRSQIVGKPLANMLSSKPADATVTLMHSRTKNLKEELLTHDIIIAAIGIANFIKACMVKEGAVVIDVGINRVNGKVVGDVDYQNVKEKASKITPVPKGVGPMTIAMLLSNTVKCHHLNKGCSTNL